MKRILLAFGILSIVLVTVTDSDAQRRRTRDRDRRDDQSEVIGKIYHSINMGNINFFSGNFSVSAKYGAGYKFSNRVSAGLSTKMFFDIINQFSGPDLNLFSFGGGAFARVKITEDIYIQGEYDLTSYDDIDFRDVYSYPLIGGGYESGQGPWKFGINGMIILNEEVRDITATGGRVVEWWFSFSYNF